MAKALPLGLVCGGDVVVEIGSRVEARREIPTGRFPAVVVVVVVVVVEVNDDG